MCYCLSNGDMHKTFVHVQNRGNCFQLTFESADTAAIDTDSLLYNVPIVIIESHINISASLFRAPLDISVPLYSIAPK